MHRQELTKNWHLRDEPLYCGKEQAANVLSKETGWLPVPSLPCDVHVPLIENGIIEEPLVADNYLRCEWTEEKSWWFKKVFDADDELIRSHRSELVIESLDVKADIFLNGTWIGHQASAFYPFRKDVRDLLLKGENQLAVRVTSGLEYYNDQDLSKIKDYISCEYKRGRGPRGDNRRALVRKAQYVYGWDWTPRLATCGIMGDAWIEACREIAVQDIRFTTNRLTDKTAEIGVEAEIENLYPIRAMDVDIDLEIFHDGILVQSARKQIYALSGTNMVRFDLIVRNPKPWWPNGMGDPALYTIRVSAISPGHNTDFKEIRAGIRTVKLNMERLGPDSRLFAFEINGVRIFCKGGNWETPDSIYGRISDETYETLVREAKTANFNMLRVNGCDACERDHFYDCCDRQGILVWQDFAGFSCAAYPDELDWFKAEVVREVDYQTRRLRNHPCLVLWCGNNENAGHLATYHHGGYWPEDRNPASPGGITLYNDVMPRIVRNNCPDIPYWNSSPYGGEADMDSNDYGDRHHWIFMSRDMEERIRPEEYDKVSSKFISEFGCVGPTKKSTLFKYYGLEKSRSERDEKSRKAARMDARDLLVDTAGMIWKTHTNTFEKDTIKAAIARHYTQSENLSLDNYLLYAGLFQGVTLGYALESMRVAKNNHGGLVWSFNDAWGEIGWSIIDYYLTRKIAYYYVKRALAHLMLTLREENGRIRIYGMNDTKEPHQFEIEYGYVSFDGVKADTKKKSVKIKPSTKAAVLAEFKRGAHDPLKGLFYAKTCDTGQNIEGILPAILRTGEFKNLLLPKPSLLVVESKECGGRITLTVKSRNYAHAVHFDFGDKVLLSDEYFDLLPGETREIRVESGKVDPDIDNLNAVGIYAPE